MPRRFIIVILLALANLSVFTVAEAAPSVERPAAAPAGPGTVVAVLDTGVSTTHPGLKSAVLPADDANGHGTAVAARIGSACPSCRILPVRVLSSSGSAPWARVAAGVIWAVDHDARVINVSIAGDAGSEALREAIAYAVSRDVLVVASAATRASGKLADWSSRGAWVDIAAPGCSLLPMVLGTYAWACGTSFAAPLAAGVAGLARAVDPAASATAIASRLPALLSSAHAPDGTLRISGQALPGATLRATAAGFSRDRDLGERVRWFRCAAKSSPHACVAVSTGYAYRVRSTDTGWSLVARVVTEPFGGLWLAASARLAVS